MRLSIGQIRQALPSAELLSTGDNDAVISSLVWDSRQVLAGGGFLALVGERFDGNDFLDQAMAAGASLLLASRRPDDQICQKARERQVCLLLVADAERALGDIAQFWRGYLTASVIGVTGSSGKTTTKEMIGKVLGRRYRTQINPGNYNTLLGLPATILSCPLSAEMLVLEMGIQHRGEIRRYCEIAAPSFAVFTNIGLAHLETLGSQTAIAEAKAELLEALPDQRGVAVLNADDPFTPYLLRYSHALKRQLEVISYGLDSTAQARAAQISLDERGCPSFQLLLPTGSGKVQLQLPGVHNVSNALAAAALGWRLGVSADQICQALSDTTALATRQELLSLPSGALILNDSYNANPDSMQAALLTLASMTGCGPHLAVLGEMYELGPQGAALHRQVGQVAAQTAVDLLITVGELAQEIAAGARAAGLASQRIIQCADWPAAASILIPRLQEPTVILVKASHSAGLDQLVVALQAAVTAGE